MNADGTGQTRLTNNGAVDYEPTWSPDGTKIAFTSSRDAGNYEVYAMNADGTNQLRLTNNAAVDQTASWSPSGSKIAFSSNRDGNYEVYTMNPDGTSQTRLTNNASSDTSPSWSPDGSRIAFFSFRDGNFEIYSMNASGGAETNLSRLPSVSDELPSWSGYFPRTPKTLVGAGGTLGTAAAGFLYGQQAGVPKSVVAFDTSTAGSRAGARIASQTATETQGSDLIFSITTSAGLASVSYVNLSAAGVPGTAVSPTIPVGSTGALVSFIASNGNVGAVIPYAANRSVGLKPTRTGSNVIYSGNFTAVYDASGKDLAPGGAKSVTLDEKTGKLVAFE
jgi:dipeptidyl aminopeptidase/acylaminoacyl peptidase